MTFKHKLSSRLARLWARRAPAAAVIAVGVTFGCLRVVPTDARTLARLVILPPLVSLPVNQSTDFYVFGITDASDTVAVAVDWSATGGTIIDSTVVNGNGMHKGHFKAGGQPGNFTVIANDPSSGKSDSSGVVVTSTNSPIASVVVIPANAGAAIGGTIQFVAVPLDANGTALGGRVISWSSSNTSVASVDGNGLATARAAGTASITATSEGVTGSGTFAVSTTVLPVASVTISPASASVVVGLTAQLSATLRDANGNTVTGRTITWSSTSTSVATVSGTGLVTGVAAGSASVIATSEGKADTAAVTVTPAAVASVSVSPAAASILAGGTIQLTATPKDASGNPLSGRTITWATSNPSVATVTTSGLVIGVAAGSAAITATSEGKSGTASVAVSAPGPSASCAPTGGGVCYWVDAVSGSDGNAGDSAHAFQTIQHAADVVNPGDWVVVRNGVYRGGSIVVTIDRGGSTSNPVVFAAQNKWGAIIDGLNNTSTIAVRFNASYVRLQGFDVRGTLHGLDLNTSAHDIQIAQNNIHDIGRICTTTTSGQSGIYSESANLLVEQNVIHDVGRFSEGESGCSYGGNNVWQNHDHGIYLKGTNIIIRSNVFYNNVHGWSIHMYGASVDQVYIVNNTFAFPNPNRIGQIIIAEPVSNSVISNNVFYQPQTAGIRWDPADGGSATNLTVENNMTAGGTVIDAQGAGITFSGNYESTDPMLVSASTLDFHLRSVSPAIRTGLSLSYVLTDFDGVSRPPGLAYDIGAFQFK